MTIKRCYHCHGPLNFNYPGPVYCSPFCRKLANALEEAVCRETYRPSYHRFPELWDALFCGCPAHADRRFELNGIEDPYWYLRRLPRANPRGRLGRRSSGNRSTPVLAYTKDPANMLGVVGAWDRSRPIPGVVWAAATALPDRRVIPSARWGSVTVRPGTGVH